MINPLRKLLQPLAFRGQRLSWETHATARYRHHFKQTHALELARLRNKPFPPYQIALYRTVFALGGHREELLRSYEPEIGTRDWRLLSWAFERAAHRADEIDAALTAMIAELDALGTTA